MGVGVGVGVGQMSGVVKSGVVKICVWLGLGFGVARVLLVGQTAPDQ